MHSVEVWQCHSVDMAERRIPSWGAQVLINEIPPPTVLFNQRGGNLALIPSACNVTCSPCLVQPEPLTSTCCAEPISLSPFSLATFTAASALMKAHLSSATQVPLTPSSGWSTEPLALPGQPYSNIPQQLIDSLSSSGFWVISVSRVQVEPRARQLTETLDIWHGRREEARGTP